MSTAGVTLAENETRIRRSKVLGSMLHRGIDIFGSIVCLMLFSPVLLVVAFLVRRDGGPALYRQMRAGFGGRTFEALKFRSMRVHNIPADQLSTLHGQVTSSHPMVTPVGKWIRRLKIDELPQAWNVLRGDMALVGPRPTIPEQVAEYTEFQRRRLDVRPGMTGWAQVHGGIELSWPERIMFDVWYVDHQSVALDFWILWRTIAVVFFGEERDSRALRQVEAHARRLTGMTELVWPQQPDDH